MKIFQKMEFWCDFAKILFWEENDFPKKCLNQKWMEVPKCDFLNSWRE
jgi:hypothetical protein